MDNNNKENKNLVLIATVAIVIAVAFFVGFNSKNPSGRTEKGTGEYSILSPDNVKETASKPSSSLSEEKTGVEQEANTVVYESRGFVPFMVEIKKGNSVHFVNKSDKAMVIKSVERPDDFYPGFSQEAGPLGKGGKFSFTFTQTGAWMYYNSANPKDQGVVIVR